MDRLRSRRAQRALFLLDGRRDPAQGRDQRLRVNPISGEPQPFGYDVRLLGEKATFSPAPNASIVTAYSWDTDDPLSLWNVQLPAGTNSRVDIDIVNTSNAYDDQNHLDRYYTDFAAQLLPAGNNAFPQPNTPYVRNLTMMPTGSSLPLARLTTGIFTAQAANYALALTYKGPRLDIGYTIGPKLHSSPKALDGIARMFFNYRVRVTSCDAADGRFPTSAGVCQFVRCPDSSFQPQNYREKDSLGLWSASGWDNVGDNATSIEGNYAPMIGGTGKAAPTVFVVGGRITLGGPSTPFTDGSMYARRLRIALECRAIRSPSCSRCGKARSTGSIGRDTGSPRYRRRSRPTARSSIPGSQVTGPEAI